MAQIIDTTQKQRYGSLTRLDFKFGQDVFKPPPPRRPPPPKRPTAPAGFDVYWPEAPKRKRKKLKDRKTRIKYPAAYLPSVGGAVLNIQQSFEPKFLTGLELRGFIKNKR